MQPIRIDPEFQSHMPALTPDEFAQLEANVLARGIRHPLVLWGDILLDGHNRYTIAQKHGLDFSTETVDLPDRPAALEWIWRNQLGRRNLTAEAARYLRGKLYEAQKTTQGGDHRSKGNICPLVDQAETLATELHVSPRTIKNDAAFARCVDTLAEAVGPEARQNILARDTRVTRQEVAALAKVAEEDPDKAKQAFAMVSSGQAPKARYALATIREEEAREKGREAETGAIIIHHGDFREVAKTLAPGSMDCIFTDPPYGAEHMPLWSSLGEVARDVLKPGGLLVAFSGKVHLPECLRRLAESLTYYWTCAAVYEGAKTSIMGIRFWGQWRPLLVFVNGEKPNHRYANDMLNLPKEERPEQELHEWEQSSVPATYWLDRLTEPGETVLDPMCGTGAFLKAADALGRRAIGIEVDLAHYEVARSVCSQPDEQDHTATPAA